MLNIDQLADLVIMPTLAHLGMYSKAAENLLLGTAAQESNLVFLQQLGGGPAVGIYQMEPNTHKDHWKYLSYKPSLSTRVRELAGHMYQGTHVPPREMIGNLYYATAMARIHYARKSEALPDADDIEGLAKYWKTYYNTSKGAGTIEQFIHNYPR